MGGTFPHTLSASQLKALGLEGEAVAQLSVGHLANEEEE